MNNYHYRWHFYLSALLLSICAVAPATAGPAWVDRQPVDTAEMVYFRGIADGADSREKAEQSAVQNLHVLVASTIMVSISSSVKEQTKTVQRGTNGAITEQFNSELDTEVESYTGMLLSGIKVESYSEAYTVAFRRQRWRAWALGAISRKQLEEEIAEYPGRISGQYSRLIANGGSLAADIRNRQGIMQALDRNPLHKAAAYLDRPEGRVNLYDYLASQINTWAGSIVFAPVPGQKAQKGETVNLPIAVSSTLYKSLGQLEYRVTLSRLNSATPAMTYNNTTIDTSPLPVGTYRGSVALRLSNLSPVLQDIKREFTLEISLSVPPNKLFSAGIFGGQWNGVVVYSANGQNHRDSYTVIFYADGTCWVAVTAQDGEAQAAKGYWSADDGTFRLDCEFPEPAITRLPALRWLARYELQNNNRRLRLNIKPAPNYSGTIGLTFNKE